MNRPWRLLSDPGDYEPTPDIIKWTRRIVKKDWIKGSVREKWKGV